MTLRIVYAESKHQEMWDRYVRATRGGSHYQLYPWRCVFAQAYGFPTYYLMALRSGEVDGVLPLFEVRSLWGKYLSSMPGGPCSTNEESLEALMDEAFTLAHQLHLPCLQFREVREEYARADLQTRRTEWKFVLPLPSTPDRLWESIHGSARRAVRKARKEGVRVVTENTHMRDFYPMYARNMRNLGTPAIPKRFFLELAKAFPERILTCIAQDRGGCALGGLILGVTSGAKMELLFAASETQSRHLRPNDLLYWDALRMCIEEEFDVFDMGRSELGSGSARFKEKWGAKPESLYYQFYSDRRSSIVADPRNDWRYRTMRRVWRYLPVPVAVRMSVPVRRFIPLG